MVVQSIAKKSGGSNFQKTSNENNLGQNTGQNSGSNSGSGNFPSLTNKNTKDEILRAYNQMKSILHIKEDEIFYGKEAKQSDEVKKKEQGREALKSANNLSLDNIIEEVAKLKRNMVMAADNLDSMLIEKRRKLGALNEAINYQESRLNELYGLGDKIDAYLVITELHERHKRQVDEEVLELKEKLKKEKKQIDDELSFYNRQQMSKYKNEEEEYKHNIALSRKLETTEYKSKIQLLTKEIEEKERILQQSSGKLDEQLLEKEQQIEELKVRAIQYEENFKSKVTAIEKGWQTKLNEELNKQKENLEAKANLSLEKLQSHIALLNKHIEKQEKHMQVLETKAFEAGERIADIARHALGVKEKEASKKDNK